MNYTLRGDVFIWIWWIMVEALPIGDVVGRRLIYNGMCFCSIKWETNMRQFVSCWVARMVWKVINEMWVSLNKVA